MAKVHVNSAGQRIYSSPYPDIPLQANPNLVDFLLHNDRPGAYPTLPAPLRMTASRLATPAFVDALTGRTQTYAELRRDVDRMALGLASPRSPWGGVEDGTVVAVFSPNHFYYATVLFGVLRAGATATTSNPFYTVC